MKDTSALMPSDVNYFVQCSRYQRSTFLPQSCISNGVPMTNRSHRKNLRADQSNPGVDDPEVGVNTRWAGAPAPLPPACAPPNNEDNMSPNGFAA